MPYYKQAGVIFETNNCTDPKERAFKIIEGSRGKYVGAVEEMMCGVCVDVTEGA